MTKLPVELVLPAVKDFPVSYFRPALSSRWLWFPGDFRFPFFLTSVCRSIWRAGSFDFPVILRFPVVRLLSGWLQFVNHFGVSVASTFWWLQFRDHFGFPVTSISLLIPNDFDLPLILISLWHQFLDTLASRRLWFSGDFDFPLTLIFWLLQIPYHFGFPGLPVTLICHWLWFPVNKFFKKNTLKY